MAVTDIVDSLAACRNLLPAVPTQAAALLMTGDCIGVHRQNKSARHRGVWVAGPNI
jgi:hypothetical protein